MARILIIDDQQMVRRNLRRILERAGHEVEDASDGKVALRRFVGNPTDLVITDVYMPNMDGIEFLIRLHETFPEAVVITMSGGGHLAKERVLEASRSLGALATLEKPLEVGAVLDEVERALRPQEAAT